MTENCGKNVIDNTKYEKYNWGEGMEWESMGQRRVQNEESQRSKAKIQLYLHLVSTDRERFPEIVCEWCHELVV